MQLNDFLKAGGPKIRKALEQHLGISHLTERRLKVMPSMMCPSWRCHLPSEKRYGHRRQASDIAGRA